jgi:hypothetical protein
MLYSFNFIVVEFLQNWFCYEFLYDILIPVVAIQCVICGFSKKYLISAAIILALSVRLLSRFRYHIVGWVLL